MSNGQNLPPALRTLRNRRRKNPLGSQCSGRNRRITFEPLEQRRLLSAVNPLDNDLPRVYVDDDAAAGGDGTSWVTAFNDLDLAVDAASAMVDPSTPGLEHVEVWIAEGAYVPTRCQDVVDPRSATFTLQANVTLVGGFEGAETASGQRARDVGGLLLHETIFSGDLGVIDVSSDNAYTVVFADSQADVVLAGLTIKGGRADGSGLAHYSSGGGAYLEGGSTILDQVTFTENECVDEGGALRALSTTVTIDECRFLDNHAILQGGSAAQGGGVTISNSSTTHITNSVFGGNTADARGGAIEIESTVTTFEDCVFRDNVSGPSGAGAAYSIGGQVRYTRVSFIENTTAGDGGAVYIAGDAWLIDCFLLANSAVNGGGVYDGSGANNPIVQSCFVGNSAIQQGGAIYGYETFIHYDTLTANRAETGGGIYATPDTWVTNTIVAGNSVEPSGSGIDVSGTVHTSSAYMLVGNSSGWADASSHTGVSGNLIGAAGTPVDPLFVRAPSDGGDGWGDDPVTAGIDESANDDFGDLRLQAASPAVNAGSNIWGLYDHDLDGSPRIVYGDLDIGPYEYQNHAPVADAGGPYDATLDGTVTLDASASTDVDLPADSISYAWDFDNDGVFDDATGIAPLFSETSAEPYVTVFLQVTDSEGAVHCDSARVYLTGSPVSPAVEGSVFHDQDEDSVWDTGEPGLEGWTVYWDRNENGIYDPSHDVSVTTDTNGDYTFTGLPGGDLLIGQVPQAAWPQTSPGGSGFHTVPLVGSTVTDVDFGNRGPISGIRGTIWFDRNSNGSFNSNEPGLAGWTVFLDWDDDGTLDAGETSVVTDADGHYELPNPGPGTPTVAVVVKPDWIQTAPEDQSYALALSGSELVDGMDFGAVLPRVCVDVDAPAGGNGLSWATAFNDLDLGLDLAADLVNESVPGMEHIEIWVADGIYLPTVRQDAGDPRSATFAMASDTSLVGGFDGTEGSPEHRVRDGGGLLVNETVLSGDLGTPGDRTDNAYTVVFASGQESIEFDGLMITGGNANGSTSSQSESGGGMYLSGGSATINDITFVDNRCTYYGGALRLYSIMATIDACRFVDNHAVLEGSSVPHGGAINVSNAMRTSITNSLFEDNTAQYRSGAIEAWYTTTTIEDSIFRGNQSGVSGAGAVYNNGSPLLATRVIFENNTTLGEGGAVYANSSVSLRDCSFFANHAGEVGGGAYNKVNSTVEQCEFVGNRADLYGGGLYAVSAEVKRSTFTANHSNQGGGLAAGSSDVILTSTLIAENTADTSGPDIFSHYQSVAAEYSLIGTPSGWPNAAGYVGQYGNVIGTVSDPIDPLFVRVPSDGGDGWTDDPATPGVDESANNDYGDLHPQPTSPAVNGGLAPTPQFLVTDLDGHPRIVHGAIDIGAFENQNHAPIANAGGPYAVLPEASVVLDASASTDPDLPHDSIVSYAWDFDDDGFFDDATGVSPIFSAVGLTDGTSVPIVLQVIDTEGAAHSDATTVYVFAVPVEVDGTAGDDTIVVTPGSVEGEIDHVVEINGTLYTYSALAVNEISINGLDGDDHITIVGTDQNEAVTLQPGSVDISGQAYELHAVNVETITVDAGTGNDQATMTGSAGSNRLYSYADHATLADSPRTFSYRVDGFDGVTVDVPTGGRNYAFLYDSPQDDTLAADPDRVALYRAVGTADLTVTTASGFARAYVYATNGGTDAAILTGSDTTRNRFYGYADYSMLTESRRSFYFYARGFDTVTGNSSGTGTTYAYLYDSAGVDSLAATPTSTTMNRAASWSDTTANGFKRVYAYSTRGGDDTALLTGNPDGGNQLRAYPTYGTLTDASRSFYHYARGFRSLTAEGSSTDPSSDRAYLYDSSGADTLVASGNSAILKDTAEATYQSEALYFDLVYARSTDAAEIGDTSQVIGELAYELIRTGTW